MRKIELIVPDVLEQEVRKALLDAGLNTDHQILKEGMELELIKILLQHEMFNLPSYLDEVFDSGGNSLGDVLEEKDLAILTEVNPNQEEEDPE